MCKNLNILKKQEELLQFEHFSNDDAFELGSFYGVLCQKAQHHDCHIYPS